MIDWWIDCFSESIWIIFLFVTALPARNGTGIDKTPPPPPTLYIYKNTKYKYQYKNTKRKEQTKRYHTQFEPPIWYRASLVYLCASQNRKPHPSHSYIYMHATIGIEIYLSTIVVVVIVIIIRSTCSPCPCLLPCQTHRAPRRAASSSTSSPSP